MTTELVTSETMTRDNLIAGHDNIRTKTITLLSGENRARGTLLGKITKSTPTTGTAAGGNTGNGLMTSVTAGLKTKLGVYSMVCKSLEGGSVSCPTTGTAGGGNVGNGTCTSVTAGSAVKSGTYRLVCVAQDGALSAPATGTAGGGNTGNGTMTGVTAGASAQVGTYTMTCIEVSGTPTAPTTGTAGGGNTGTGTMTSVTAGSSAQLGTYTMTCIAQDGSISCPATGTAGTNTGDGTCTGVTAGADAVPGTYLARCIATAMDSGTFEILTPTGERLSDATVAVAYTSDQINLTINDGATDFALGDTFAIAMTRVNGGLFSVVSPLGNNMPNASVGVAYTNAQINFTINDGATDFVVGDTFTVAVTRPNGGTFSVIAPDGLNLPNATVAAAFTNAQINFTINDGGTDFIVGDTFTVPVTRVNGGLFSVTDPNGNLLNNASVGVAFTSLHINFTINDGATDFAVGDLFTIAAALVNGGTWSVKDPEGNSMPDATTGVAYTNAQLNFTINDGATDFAVNDAFSVTVAAGSGKYKIATSTAVDGSQELDNAVILARATDATSGDETTLCYEAGEFNQNEMTFGSGLSASSAAADLAKRGIYLRDTIAA